MQFHYVIMSLCGARFNNESGFLVRKNWAETGSKLLKCNVDTYISCATTCNIYFKPVNLIQSMYRIIMNTDYNYKD